MMSETDVRRLIVGRPEAFGEWRCGRDGREAGPGCLSLGCDLFDS